MNCLAVLPLFKSGLENAPHQNDGKCYKVNDCFHFGNNHFTNQFKLTSILKSGPEIENRCSGWAVLEVFLAAIAKFTP